MVCVKDHSSGAVKKGQEFTVLNVREPFCKCKESIIYIGLNRNYTQIKCARCGIDAPVKMGELWFAASLFAPIQEYGDSMSIAMELIQDMERVDKPVNPKVKEVQNA